MWDCRVLKRKQSRMMRQSQSSGILMLIFYNSMHTTTALSPCSFTSFCVDSLNTSLSLCPFRDGYPLFPFLALSFSPLSSPFQFVLFHSSLSVTKLFLYSTSPVFCCCCCSYHILNSHFSFSIL